MWIGVFAFTAVVWSPPGSSSLASPFSSLVISGLPEAEAMAATPLPLPRPAAAMVAAVVAAAAAVVVVVLIFGSRCTVFSPAAALL